MELDVRTRRIGFVSLLVVAILAFIVALAVTLLASPNAGTWLLVAVVVLVLALAGELFLLVWGEQKAFDEENREWYDWEAETAEGDDLLLRCSGCQETFTILDSGERPLRHTCPHCGRAGTLKDRPTEGAAPAPGA